MKCPNCNSDISGNFCSNCGYEPPKKQTCSHCGNEFTGNFCDNCGKKPTPSIDHICHNMYDRNDNHIDVYKLASVYRTYDELTGYFKRNTIFTDDEIEKLVLYISKNIKKEDIGFFSGVSLRSSFESAGYQQANYIEKNQTPFFSQSKDRPHKKSKRELKRDAHNSGQACCPKCASVSLTANKKGFGLVKGAVGTLGGGFLLGGVGAIAGLGAGNINAKKVWVTCLNCGHRWKL